MNTINKEMQNLRGIPKFIGVIVGFVFLLAFGSSLSRLIIFRYQVSTGWMQAATPFATTFGLIVAIAAVWLILPPIIRQVSTERLAAAKILLMMFFTPPFAFFLGAEIVLATGPMILATTIGYKIEIPFVVHGPAGYDRHCRSGVSLENLPIMFDKLCGISAEFRDSLSTGTHILVSGRGTDMGVFVDSVRIVESRKR